MAITTIFKKLRFTSIRSQLILGIAIFNIVLMLVFITELMNKQKAFFLKLNRDQAMGLSINLASTANSYVISYELARLQKLVSTYKEIPNLQYAIITSDDGTVLAHTNQKYLGMKATDSISAKLKSVNTKQILLDNSDILDIASPIINRNEVVGWARIGISQKYIEPNIAEIKQRGLLYILISLIVGSVFAVIVATGLSRGLQKLVTAAKKIKDGNRDLRVEPSKSIEMDELGTAFNQMLDNINSNEKLLSNVLDNLPVGVWILDEKGKIISCNPAGEEMWKGIKYVGVEEYNIYKAWFTETGKEVQNHEWGASIALAEGKSVLNQEIEIECFDKSHKIILNSAIPLRDTNEKITGVITINVDITNRKMSETKIKERESQLTTLFENIEGATSLLDSEKKYVLFNQRFVSDHRLLSGNDPQVGQLVYDFLPPDLLEKRLKMLDGVLKGNKEVVETNHISNGKRVYYRSSFSPVITDGKVTGISTYSIDLTQSKEAEIKVRESEEKFRMSFMTSPDAFYISTLNGGKIVDINDGFYNVFGFSREDVIGKTSLELNIFSDLDDRTLLIAELKANSRVKDLEIKARKKNGELITVSISANLLEINNEKFILAVIRDTTERKKAQDDLKEMNEKLRLLSSHLQNIREEERTSIAREVHDELGQQLTGLKMDIISFKRDNENIFPEIIKETDSMIQLIDEAVKTVRRIATELRPGILDDLGLAAAIEWQGHEFEKRTGIKCTVDTKGVSDEYPREINTAVFRIFQESLTNIARHAEAKEVTAKLCEDTGALFL